MRTVKTFGDISGGATGQVALVAATYTNFSDEWTKFEHEWSAALDDAGVSAFHATDFFCFHREFESWKTDHAKHVEFAKRFTAIAAQRGGIGIARGLEFKAYESVLGETLTTIENTPRGRVTPRMHVVCGALASVSKHLDAAGLETTVVMEDEAGMGEIIKFFEAEKKKGEPWTKNIASVTSAAKNCLPLQAADLLAHELWRDGKGRMSPDGRAQRKSLERLLEPRRIEFSIIRDEHLPRLRDVWVDYLENGDPEEEL